MIRAIPIGALALAAAISSAQPLTTAFTYQGRLDSSGAPASGVYDFKFTLFDGAAGGAQVGPQLCSDNLTVTAGTFAAQLNFGAQFVGQQRFLEIWVRPDTGLACGSNTGFSILGPRQPLTAAPSSDFALAAASAMTADNATQLNSQPASFYTNAANLTTGTIPDARLATSVARLNTTQTFTGATTFSTPPSFSAAGAPFSVSSTTLVPNLNADLLDGLSSSAFLQSIPNPFSLSGSSAPQIILGQNASGTSGATGVTGMSTATTGIHQGVFGLSNSTAGRGVFGWADAATGTTAGVSGLSDSTTGRGVYGEATATSGTPSGVYGLSHSPNSYGVYGETTSHNGAGVYGIASTTTDFSGVGVYGVSNSPSYGYGVLGSALYNGVFGYVTAPSSNGVYGQSTDPAGRGVIGWASSGTGSCYGVWGQSDSSTGRGVYGNNNTPTGTTYGGRFEADSTTGRAVYGLCSASGGSDAPYAVRGQAPTSTAGFAVYAVGDMGASGVKPFRIDHPQDPANKYLLHYAAESPDVINFYSGKATLNERGEATVELPAYFATINKDPRYQLTPIGAPMPLLHIAEEVSESALAEGENAQPGDPVPTCSFTIAGGAPNARVSWEVKALRNDLRIRLHGAPVEREKTGPERGRYQHPDYYNLPQDMGMDDLASPTLPKPIPPSLHATQPTK